VGSAIERSSSGSPSDESSEDSCVLFSSDERMVDFPEDVVLPVVNRSWEGEGLSSDLST